MKKDSFITDKTLLNKGVKTKTTKPSLLKEVLSIPSKDEPKVPEEKPVQGLEKKPNRKVSSAPPKLTLI